MPDFRRGAEAIADAQKQARSNGSFTPFTPSLFWSDPAKNAEGAERFLMFLNPMLDIPTVEMIGFIPQAGKKGNGDKFTYYESVISRTDPAIGESVDPLSRDWEAQPRDTNIAVAVELVPVLEERNGRKRPVGFEVATTSFDRRIRDDEDNLTEETETVEAPVVGFVQQSPHNFFNLVSSFDGDTAPIESTALKIKRIDQKTYTVEGFLDAPVDLSALIDYFDNLSYLGDDVDDLIEIVEATEDDADAVSAIGAFLLDKRLAELADGDRYEKLAESVTESLDAFGGKGKDKKAAAKKERPARRSSRRSRNEPDPGPQNSIADPESDVEPEVKEEAPAEEKPTPRRRSRAKKEEALAEEPAAEEKPQPNRDRAAASKAKLDELRAKQEKRRAAAA